MGETIKVKTPGVGEVVELPPGWEPVGEGVEEEGVEKEREYAGEGVARGESVVEGEGERERLSLDEAVAERDMRGVLLSVSHELGEDVPRARDPVTEGEPDCVGEREGELVELSVLRGLLETEGEVEEDVQALDGKGGDCKVKRMSTTTSYSGRGADWGRGRSLTTLFSKPG